MVRFQIELDRIAKRFGEHGATLSAVAMTLAACGEVPDSPPAVSLVEHFSTAIVEGTPDAVPEFPILQWTFDAESTIPLSEDPGSNMGWTALNDVADLAVEDGRLVGRSTGLYPIVSVAIPENALPRDLLAAMEIELQASAGKRIGVFTLEQEEIDVEEMIRYLETDFSTFLSDFEPGDQRTIKLTEDDMPFTTSVALGGIRHLAIGLVDADGAEIAIDSVGITTRNEELATIESGIGWQGLGDIFRETLVSRSPERVDFEIELGERPWFDLAVGTPSPGPVTFHIDIASDGVETVSLRRTVTSADRWHDVAVPLDTLAGRRVRISLALSAEDDGKIAFWGTPTVRHRGAKPVAVEPTPARAALGRTGPPRGVILVVADTLRPDHLETWGYERPTAPILAELAAGGVRMADNISQGTWTKVAVPSILSSLYATTHSIYDTIHKLPDSVTTLAEAFRGAGYATFHTSSVVFTGRNSNLQQGVEVLHERSSIEGLEGYDSKTARVYVDRTIDWLEAHHEQPFFVFLHVFDPHSPFRPFEPYDRRWLEDEAVAKHQESLKEVDELVDVFHNLPSAEDLQKSDSIDEAEFLRASRAWYDGSIRSMDDEIGRLVERLDELGLSRDTLIAFVADHGEEFHEHGESWHGHSVYGDMINVPMILHWPGVVPAGAVIETTTQSIDLMPTLLELAQIPVPETAQGRSLVPLMADPVDLAASIWRDRPVFSERKNASTEQDEQAPDAYAVVHDGWKLIWNAVVRDDRAEFELFDHRSDPINMHNIADAHPTRVAELKQLIEEWRVSAEAARVQGENSDESLSPEELDQLRALGYLN